MQINLNLRQSRRRVFKQEQLLINLPAKLEAGLSRKVLNKLCEQLSYADTVEDGSRLAFLMLDTYRALKLSDNEGAGMVMDALEKAVWRSAAVIPGFDAYTRVLIAADTSGSMKQPVRHGSKVQNFDIGLLLAMLLQSRSEQVITGIFGNKWKTIELPQQNILAAMDKLHGREGEVGFATNGWLVIQDLLKKKLVMDKVLIFTDCSLWDRRQPNQSAGTDISRLWRQYKQIAPWAKLYLFDLGAYGNASVRLLEDGVYQVAGWRETIFQELEAAQELGL